MTRCPWVDPTKPDYVRYHDEEWGVPLRDDRKLFELLILESAQAGLSWYTVLRKREGYRTAFAGFDPQAMAGFTAVDADRLMGDPGIIRNRRKIESAIVNARAYLRLVEHGDSFADYIWRFVDGRPIIHRLRTLSDYPVTIAQSDALARDLKSRGFRFLGPTTCYAFMQAAGLVNDHSLDCFRRRELLETPEGP